jgi:hypothetical protein
LVAKTLQALANGCPFGEKEPYMIALNHWIVDNIPRMNQFLSKVSTVTTPISSSIPQSEDVEILDLALFSGLIGSLSNSSQTLPEGKDILDMMAIVETIQMKTKRFRSQSLS